MFGIVLQQFITIGVNYGTTTVFRFNVLKQVNGKSLRLVLIQIYIKKSLVMIKDIVDGGRRDCTVLITGH